MDAADTRRDGPAAKPVNSGDPRRNAETISALATELGIPVAEVTRVYERHYARLKSEASVGQYLGLLAARRTRDELRNGRAQPRGTGGPT